MLKWFRERYKALQERRRIARELDPKVFQRLARELNELATLAERVHPLEKPFAARIKRIQDEMAQLQQMASEPEFKRLSPQKRLQLKQSLLESREQLVESVQTAPSPTDRLQ